MATVHLPIRQLVEFLLRTGSIDSRFTGFDRALEGAHIHRKLQKAAGDGYQAEVFLSVERQAEDITFTLEGRADGIFTDETGTVVIDEIKTTAVPPEEITEDMNPCHWAQGMVYGAIYAAQQSLPELNVRLTYYQIDTDQIIRFIRRFTQQELDEFLDKLLCQYAPWAQRRIEWDVKRTQSLAALQFPFAQYRPGQRAMAGEIYRACRAGKTADCKGGTRLFCQAPTGIGKTMSALFPALKAMGEGNGEKLFYLTARNTTQTAAEDALTRLHTAQPELALRSVTLTAKEKVCLHPDAEGHPACLPELCPYANGYYDRIKDALTALLDGTGSFDRAALAGAAKRFSVCPFELGLDLSEWCDVVIGDYNYLFDPVVHLKRFFDSSGDWLFLVDEAHNLPDRARAMYSARFCKSSLTEAKRALGKGKSALKTALTKADKALLEARKACIQLAPRHSSQTDAADPAQTSLLPENTAPALELPEPLYAQDSTVFCRSRPLPCSVRCGPYRHLCRIGWKRTRMPKHMHSCWSFILLYRTSPVPPNDTTATLSLSLPRAAESLNCSCCVWTRHLLWMPALPQGAAQRCSVQHWLRPRSTAVFWAVAMHVPSHWTVPSRLKIWGCIACRISLPATATAKPACRQFRMHWPGWCRPEPETTLPFSQATHICGRYTKILQHVTRAFAPLCRKAVWMMPLGLNFWLSLCRTRPKHFWVLA